MAKSRDSYSSVSGGRSSSESKNTKLARKMAIVCCVCLCFVAVLLCIVLTAFVVRSLETEKPHPKHVKNATCVELELEKIGFPKNISEFIKQKERLCNSSGCKPELDEFGGPAHIYIVKANKNLTKVQACGVESILRLFPDKTVFLIDFHKQKDKIFNRCSSPPDYLGLLLYLYQDRLEVVAAKSDVFFKKTPLENLTKSGEHFEFLAMLLTAYRYGGYVASPSMVMTKRYFVDCLPEETIVEPFTILTPRTCDDFLHYLMQSFVLCSVQDNNLTLDDILTQSTELFSKSSSWPRAQRMDSTEISFSPRNHTGTFLKIRQPEHPECEEEDPKEVCELSSFCKQVVQAFLGLKLNQMEVDEETKRMKEQIIVNRKTCAAPRRNEFEEHATADVGLRETTVEISLTHETEHETERDVEHREEKFTDFYMKLTTDFEYITRDHLNQHEVDHQHQHNTEHGTGHHTKHHKEHHIDHEEEHPTEHNTEQNNEHNTEHHTEQEPEHQTERHTEHHTKHHKEHNTEYEAEHNTEQEGEHNTERHTELETEHQTEHHTEQETEHHTNHHKEHHTEHETEHHHTEHHKEHHTEHDTEHHTEHHKEHHTEHETEDHSEHNSEHRETTNEPENTPFSTDDHILEDV